MLAMQCDQRNPHTAPRGPHLPLDACQQRLDRFNIKRPIQLAATRVIAQHRYPQSIALLQRAIAIDENAFELRHARDRQRIQGQVAQVAVITLIKDQSHTHASGWLR